MRLKRILLVTGLLVLVVPAPAGYAERVERTITNPVGYNPDPSVVVKDGYYHSNRSAAQGLEITRTRTITAIDTGPETKVLFPNSPDYDWIWNGQLHLFENHWYLYSSARDRAWNRRIFVLRSDTEDFMGAWTNLGRLTPEDNRYGDEADGTVLVNPHQLPGTAPYWFVFSGHPAGSWVNPAVLYIAPMSDPTTLSGPATVLARPVEPWEGEVVEAPAATYRGGTTYLAYSGNDYRSPSYALGLLVNTDGDYANPASWTRSQAPLFKGTDQVLGPGSVSFITSPDGTEDWLVYHAKWVARSTDLNLVPGADVNGALDGWRYTAAQRFTWGSDGLPVFGEPVAMGTPMQRPSGEDLLSSYP